MEAEGWYYDPFGVHEQRWYSWGKPTSLVRDDDRESYDDPPAGAPRVALVAARVPESRAPLGTTLGVPPAGGYVVLPPPRSARQTCRLIALYFVIPSVTAGLILLGVFELFDPQQALAAGGVAALIALYIGVRCSRVNHQLRVWRANRDADWSNDLYPR